MTTQKRAMIPLTDDKRAGQPYAGGAVLVCPRCSYKTRLIVMGQRHYRTKTARCLECFTQWTFSDPAPESAWLAWDEG